MYYSGKTVRNIHDAIDLKFNRAAEALDKIISERAKEDEHAIHEALGILTLKEQYQKVTGDSLCVAPFSSARWISPKPWEQQREPDNPLGKAYRAKAESYRSLFTLKDTLSQAQEEAHVAVVTGNKAELLERIDAQIQDALALAKV